MNELYLPSVLYATRDRLDRNEEEYWMRSDILQRGGMCLVPGVECTKWGRYRGRDCQILIMEN